MHISNYVWLCGGGAGDQAGVSDELKDNSDQRSAQMFSEQPWSPQGPGYGLDSATSMWVSPVPDVGITPGDIAEDYTLPVTAIVKANGNVAGDPNQPGTQVELRAFDSSGGMIADFSDTFSAGSGLTGLNYNFCRQPAVEVTYYRKESEQEGILKIIVVWAQLTVHPDPEFTQWDLYHMTYNFTVDSGGVDWNPSIYGPARLAYESPQINTRENDEEDPDLAVSPENDGAEMLLVFKYSDLVWDFGEGEYISANPQIKAYYGVSFDILSCDESAYTISYMGASQMGSPSADIGWITSYGFADCETGAVVMNKYQAVAAWTEEHHGQWFLFYGVWGPSDYLLCCDPFYLPIPKQVGVSDPDIWKGLPQVDIPSPSSMNIGAAHTVRAVVTWMELSQEGSPGDFHTPKVKAMVVPGGISPYTISGLALAPDVACYQMSPNSDPLAGDVQWFGISFYKTEADDPPNDTWDDSVVDMMVVSFKYDANGPSITIAPNGWDADPSLGGFWSWDTPDTGTTICLRSPGLPLIWQKFGLGWIEGTTGNLTTWVADGNIT